MDGKEKGRKRKSKIEEWKKRNIPKLKAEEKQHITLSGKEVPSRAPMPVNKTFSHTHF